MATYSNVIWDWNGTLFDDVSACIEAMNTMLGRRGMSELESVAAYRSLFGFPVQDFYRRLGFDFSKEPFADLSAEYNPIYHQLASRAHLFPGAEATLEVIRRGGVRQVILSATQMDNLISQISPFGISGYFDEILGLPDILAASKIELGKQYIARVRPQRTLLIGDTVHDKEVADALGADCVLIAAGHQDRLILVDRGATVIDSIADLADIVL